MGNRVCKSKSFRFGPNMKKENELQILQAAINLGVQISFDAWNIKPGDLYFAVKNTGVKLLTCKSNNGSFVVPIENNYWYNLCDCVRIIE